MDKVKVSVIVVSYNSEAYINKCIEALQKQTLKDFEIIIVDNCSKDNSLNLLREYKDIILIQSDINLGFAGACNLGYKNAKGIYIAMLNPDAIAQESYLEEQIKVLDNNSNIGITASKMIVKGTNIIDSASDCYSNAFKSFKRGEGKPEHLFNQDGYVWGACGGACIYRAKMLQEIGLYDEDFFLIHEDSDLNFRAKLAGWDCYFVHNAIVYHDVRSSIGKMSDMAIFYSIRNNSLVRIKNIPTKLFITNFITYFMGLIIEFYVFSLKYKRPNLYFKAKFYIFKNKKALKVKRNSIKALTKVKVNLINNQLVDVFHKI